MRYLVGALIAALVVLALTLFWHRVEGTYPILRFERSREAQRVANLRAYAARERLGSFLPPGDVQLALRESLLQDILARSLPIRQTFENGRYEARLDRALLDIGDGLASITLLGRGRVIGRNASPIEVYLRIQTHIDVVEFRPDVGTLRAGLAITAAHVVRSGGGPAAFMAPAARFFSSLKVEDWNRQRPSLDIPIRLEQQVTLPAFEGDLSLDSCLIPLVVGVSTLTVLQDRLVISFALAPDMESGEGAGAPRPEWAAPKPEDLKQAEKEAERLYRGGRLNLRRDALIQRVRALAGRDSLWQGLMGSDRDVVAIAPLPVLQTLCNRVARNYVQGARLDFNPKIRAHLDEEIRFKLLGGSAGAGRIVGDVHVDELRGRLRVEEAPKVTLLPPDGLQLTTPIRVVEGSGRVRLDMKWDPAFLVSIVCRGFGFQEVLTGEVLPFSHALQTRIRFYADSSRFVGRPLVRRDRIAVPCEFTAPSLAKVRAALLEQDKLLRCGTVMNADTVVTKLRKLVRRKVRVSLPGTLFKPFSVPVSLRQQYDTGEFRITARMEDPEVMVRPEYLRFGFRAALKVQPFDSGGP
ncbi:MAG TPA: hypothetical protein VFS09_06335 [Candidatus Eisenbacteria bacterium]|nr:hypothetical protein [Candidatus Eisenbacteria bacterium]